MLHPSIRRLPWPLPALLAWLLAWSLFGAAAAAGAAPALSFALAAGAGGAVAVGASGAWRRLLAAAGFPLSALALGALPSLPAWGWLLAVLPLLLAYPLRAWRDAPFFPTPADSLEGLDRAVRLPRAGEGARVLDAGCGLGHALQALRRIWPQAQLEGLEWSLPLSWGAAWRCRFARVSKADMWAASWAGFDVVYLFQRPESMARAMAKAEREMTAGRWLVSLEFPVPGCPPLAKCGVTGGRPVWVYRIGGSPGSINSGTRR